MNTTQVRHIIEAWMTQEWGELAWGELSEGDVDIPGLGHVECVDRQDDRDSSVRWFILKIDDRFYEKRGYHVSHDGTYWDGGFEEVKPTEKVVTVWV